MARGLFADVRGGERFGSWLLARGLRHWGLVPEQGLVRSTGFAQSISVAFCEGPVEPGTTLEDFVAKEESLIAGQLEEPRIGPARAMRVTGAEATMALEVAHRLTDGREVRQKLLFARSGDLFGTVTLTSMAAEADAADREFAEVAAALTFTNSGPPHGSR